MFRNKFGALVVGALLLFSAPSYGHDAQPPPFNSAQQCHPLELVQRTLNAQFPIRKIVKLDAQQTKDVLAWWNSQPPESDDKYDEIFLIQHEGFMALMLGNAGMVCVLGRIPPELMESFLKALHGSRA
jgi:hypothetical protein